MKRIYIIVEGQTEKEFVQEIIAPYLQTYHIYSVTPILIHTSKIGRGGFVNYAHLKNDILKLLHSSQKDILVTMLVDFFRCPELPHKEQWEAITDHKKQVEKMEYCIQEDIHDERFIPYIQLHEFEALLFASNAGFEEYFTESQQKETNAIVQHFENPEDINSTPEGAPSKRILAIRDNYDKVIQGNLIALHVGIEKMLEKCPRFNKWVERLIEACNS